MSEDHGERLARIETKVDLVLDSMGKLDTRTSAVEKKQWMHSGVVAVIAVYLSKFGIPIPH